MPLSEEDKKEIQELISGVIASSVSPLSEKLEGIQTEYTRQIDGLAAKFKKQQSTAISDLSQQITDITEQLSGFKKTPEKTQDGQTEKPIDQPNAEMAKLQEQLKLLQGNLEQEQKARQVAETQRMLSTQQTQLVTKLTGKVIDPNSFFTLATNDGYIKQGKSSDGMDYYYLERKDAIGELQPIPLTSEEGMAIASQIAEQKYPYLVAARPGKGGGTSNGQSPQTQSKYFNGSPSQDDITAAIASGKSADVYAELEKMIQS